MSYCDWAADAFGWLSTCVLTAYDANPDKPEITNDFCSIYKLNAFEISHDEVADVIFNNKYMSDMDAMRYRELYKAYKLGNENHADSKKLLNILNDGRKMIKKSNQLHEILLNVSPLDFDFEKNLLSLDLYQQNDENKFMLPYRVDYNSTFHVYMQHRCNTECAVYEYILSDWIIFISHYYHNSERYQKDSPIFTGLRIVKYYLDKYKHFFLEKRGRKYEYCFLNSALSYILPSQIMTCISYSLFMLGLQNRKQYIYFPMNLCAFQRFMAFDINDTYLGRFVESLIFFNKIRDNTSSQRR